MRRIALVHVCVVLFVVSCTLLWLFGHGFHVVLVMFCGLTGYVLYLASRSSRFALCGSAIYSVAMSVVCDPNVVAMFLTCVGSVSLTYIMYRMHVVTYHEEHGQDRATRGEVEEARGEGGATVQYC